MMEMAFGEAEAVLGEGDEDFGVEACFGEAAGFLPEGCG